MSRYWDIDPQDIDPETGCPYSNYSSDSLDTSFHDNEMDVDDDEEQPDPLLRAEAAETLLKEALALFNSEPDFKLRHDPNRTSYKLAAKIDRHFKEQGE